jgi:hypothetical protein
MWPCALQMTPSFDFSASCPAHVEKQLTKQPHCMKLHQSIVDTFCDYPHGGSRARLVWTSAFFIKENALTGVSNIGDGWVIEYKQRSTSISPTREPQYDITIKGPDSVRYCSMRTLVVGLKAWLDKRCEISYN